jgi:hypothetical protein
MTDTRRAMKKPTLESAKKYAPPKGGPACMTCSSPYLDWIREARIAGLSFPTIANYLTEEFGFRGTASAIQRHFTIHEKSVN